MATFHAKAHDALAEVSDTGKFIRTASGFREIISHDHPIYKPEAGRYHLYISYACPWANRCLAILKLKGLEQAGIVTFTAVHPTWQRTRPQDAEDKHCGWAFYDSSSKIPLKNSNGFGAFVVEGCEPDPNHSAEEGVAFIRDLYEKSNDQWRKFTVPVLWDKKTKTIVNNESSEIVRMFTSKDFEALLEEATAANKDLPVTPLSKHDFYPLNKRPEIDALNDWIYTDINDGVYKCGFAKSQQAYEEAMEHLYRGLDRVEDILSQSRYLLGNKIEDFTEADIRLFMTLIRFDEVYIVYFKCNQKTLKNDYPNIRNYLRDLYQLPFMNDCIRMEHIKIHYFS